MTTTSPTSPTVEALRKELARNKRVHAWQLRSTRHVGSQTYLVKTQLESERQTSGETHELTVFVKNGELLGRATATLDDQSAAAAERRIDESVYMAGLGGDAPWTLPTADQWPEVQIFDPALSAAQARATSRAVADAWRAEAAAHPGVRPSSMELFCGEEWTTLENSAGLVAHGSATRISLLTLLLGEGSKPSERYSWVERRRASDLDVKDIVGRAAEEARDLTRAVVPPSGQYGVIIDADEIVGLMAPIETNASGEGLYQKSSRFEVGKPLPGEAAKGESFNMYSNAIAPYGLTSYVFDGNGVAGRRVQIVKDGVFTQPWATKQFADYLHMTPTGGFANLEIPTGNTPLETLKNGDGKVLYVRSFSWLTPDQQRGNFSSEVRVGYLYEKGVRTPIKGGSVSGSVFSALGAAHYAKEQVFRGDYLGPEGIRFDGLTVSGA